MMTMLQKRRAEAKAAKAAKAYDPSSEEGYCLYPKVVRTNYTNLPVALPDSFLAPLTDPSIIKVSQIDFKNSPLPEYSTCYAVVLDNVLTQEECDQLIKMAEMSVGAHQDGDETGPENNGWKPAMVNAGRNKEFLDTGYRNSDRIIWDEKTVVKRLWDRVMQGEGMKEYFSALQGEKYIPIVGQTAVDKYERWVVTKQGLNERMRFLKYGPGQYFKGLRDFPFKVRQGH